jgi:hypothetical protein
MWRQSLDRMAVYLKNQHPNVCGVWTDAECVEFIQEGVAKAARHAIEREEDVRRYLEWMVLLGPDFDADPKTEWAGQILRRKDLWPWEKLEGIKNYAAMVLKGEV